MSNQVDQGETCHQRCKLRLNLFLRWNQLVWLWMVR